MKYLFLFIFFYSFDSFCHDEHDHEHVANPCDGKVQLLKFPEIEKLNERLEWFGASNTEVASSPCKAKVLPSSEEMDQVIKAKAKGDSSQNTTVNGIEFRGESAALVKAFRDLTTAKDSFGWSAKPQSQKNFQKDFNVNPECKKVICAMEKIWGKNLAEKMLYIKLKHNYNTSEYAFDSSSRFEEKEMNDVMLALEDLPQHLQPLGKPNQRLTLFERGYTLASYGQNSNVLANAVIMLFGGWSKSEPLKRQYATYHEFSHNISDFYSDLDNSPKWLKMSGWTKKGDEWESGKDACFTSKYGLTNPAEDFAESISAYRYGPSEFKKSCPKKYDFIKSEVYKGVEYLNIDSCIQIPKKNQDSFFSEIEEKLNGHLESKIDPEAIQKSCPDLIEMKLNKMAIESCYAKVLKESLMNENKELLSAAMSKAGIKNTDHNLTMLMSVYNERNTEKVAPQLEGIKSKVDSDIEKIISKGMPEKVKPHFDFDRACSKEIWDGNIEGMRECAASGLINDDKKWRVFSAGKIFPKLNLPKDITEEAKTDIEEKRDAAFVKLMKSSTMMDEDINKAISYKKQVVNYHFLISEQKLRADRTDWKTMEPKEFCSNFYAPSDSVKRQIPKDSDNIPGFTEWCESKQGAARKRYSFSKKEVDEFVQGKK